MDNEILSLIEEGINSKKKDIISKISSKIEMDIPQTILFLKYFQKFIVISSVLDSQYVNYFGGVCLTKLKEKDEIANANESFVKAIIIFIKEKRKNKNIYYVNLENENDIKLEILILSQLDYKSFEYDISYNENINFKEHLYIFKYIQNIKDIYLFNTLSKELIEQQIDSPLINYIDLDKIPFKTILEYCKKYPNRIRYLDLYNFKQYDKIKELLELNKESLVCYPHSKFEYLIPLPNAYILNFSDFGENIDNNYDFSKIKYIYRIWHNDQEEDLLINLLNKCPNVEELEFYEIGSDYLLNILKNINCPKIKKFTVTCEDYEQEDFDWEGIFEKYPLLENISIEEHQTMFWTYEISPIFLAEKKRLPFPLLEQLIRNYLNGSPDRDIILRFDEEFNEFWDYFKNKKDILNRISDLCSESNFQKLDYCFKALIGKNTKINSFKQDKYMYLFVEREFDEEINEFIKNKKIEYLFIKGGGDINFAELIKSDHLKFIFDNSSKIIFFRKKNILEKI